MGNDKLVHGNTGKKHSKEVREKLSRIKKEKFGTGELSFVGEKSPAWKGGIRKEKCRIRTYMPTHPLADSAGYVAEHRLVAEKALGRYLKPHEVIHHIDRDPHNNKNSNLLICDQSYHIFLHHRMGTLCR